MKKVVILAVIIFAGFSFFFSKAEASGYNLIIDDTFHRADTVVGTTSTSTNLGNGWVDFVGSYYVIKNNSLLDESSFVQQSGPNLHPVLTGFYHNASTSDSFQNGKVRVWNGGGSNITALARFDPTNGGSGYVALYSQGQVNFYRGKNGSEGTLTGFDGGSVLPAGFPNTPIIGELIVQDINATTTKLIFNLYAQSAPNTILATFTYTDTDSPIQAPGYWGASGLNYGPEETGYSEIQTYSFSSGGPIVPGAISVNAFKTKVGLDSLPAIGGIPPYTYQWQRSLSATTGFTNVPNGTSIVYNGAITVNTTNSYAGFSLQSSFSDDTVSPGATYYYRMDVRDSTGGTPLEATSTTMQVTTAASSSHTLGFIGDSITLGTGSSNYRGATLIAGINNSPGAVVEYLTLQNAGYAMSAYNNQGIPGSSTGGWVTGGGAFINAVNSFKLMGIDTVSIMLGTNDARAGVSSASYGAALQNIVDGLLAPGTGITRVILNYPIYDGQDEGSSHTVYDATLVSYQPVINSIASSTPGVYLGDTTLYANSETNASTYGLGLHPNDLGHAYMGKAWAQAYVATFESPVDQAAAPGSTGATITWTTSVSNSSIVRYGLDDTYGSSEINASLVTSHNISLSGLSTCTTYHYSVSGSDSQNLMATSSDQTFTTTGCIPAYGGAGYVPMYTAGTIPVVTPTPSTTNTSETATTTTPTTPAAVDLGCQAGFSFSISTGHACTISATTPTVPTHYTFLTNLSYHMKGSEVFKLQEYLQSQGLFATTPNGIFGPITLASVIKFQKLHNITPAAGYFGSMTRGWVNTH